MYYLEKDSNITFDLNYDVEPYIKALFPYTDKDGHQYISFQNGFIVIFFHKSPYF